MARPYSIKLANTVLYLLHQCAPVRPGLTTLLKMLFFSDYLHYRRHLKTITGSDYVALERGPVINNYRQIFEAMETDDVLDRHLATVLGHVEKKHEYRPKQEPDASVFSETEIQVLDSVAKECGRLSGAVLSERSHLEGPWAFAWNPAQQGNPIPAVLFRWLDNLPDDGALESAREAVAGLDLQHIVEQARNQG